MLHSPERAFCLHSTSPSSSSCTYHWQKDRKTFYRLFPCPQQKMKSDTMIKDKSPSFHHHHPPAMGTWGGSSAGGSRSRGGIKYKIKYYTVYKFYVRSVLLTFILTLFCFSGGPYPPVVDGGNPDAKRLYDDLLSNYNKLVRPVVNVSEAVTVMLKLKLSQLIDVVSHLIMFRLILFIIPSC